MADQIIFDALDRLALHEGEGEGGRWPIDVWTVQPLT